MKVAAGITLYNPEIPRLEENLKSVTPQVEKVYIIDNGSQNITDIRSLISEFKSVSLFENGENLGIAAALNQMSKSAFEEGYEWLLTLDQDTVIESELIKKYSRYTEMDKVALLTPYIDDEYEPDILRSSISTPYETVKRCYTSASLTLLSAWKEVGGYDESMFIDCVDFDYCTTLIENGYIILRDNDAVVSHRLGKAKEVRFFMPIGRLFNIQKLKKPFFTYNHSPLRTYYYARNI
ncbi:MAG: glycosyltransferase family 2 protein, partial [Clostridia bacterium]|nr:glycosyltransferase family 2 protein [Clostridia bacterium]